MKPTVIIVTGLSGSGKSVALRAFEDIGYTCVDNLPPKLLDAFVSIEAKEAGITKIVAGIDIRERSFLKDVHGIMSGLREKYDIEIIYLEADTNTLVRRYKETRRPHPLGMDDLASAVAKEAKALQPLRESAGRIIDTSSFSPHQLRSQIVSIYGGREAAEVMSVTLISFGYKYGIPQSADLLVDVRFLPNPYFVPDLKDLKGSDRPVREFVLERPETGEFNKKALDFLEFLLPRYKNEGRSNLTIGIGCTGGRHRSPVIADALGPAIRRMGYKVNIVHREI